MKKKINYVLGILLALVCVPIGVNADTITVCSNGCDYTSLKDAVTAANDKDVISVTEDLKINNNSEIIEVLDKEITIDGGSGVTITGYRDTTPLDKTNHTMIAAAENSKIYLKNIKIVDAQKYGVQAYNGGYVSLDNVTIDNCRYAGILVNAGTVEIINLSLGTNGENSNKGIEISKSINIENSDNEPQLFMNGTISSTNKDGVIYFADDDNDATKGFTIDNSDTTTDKILANGTKVVITDSNNEVKYTSNEIKDTTTIQGDDYVENVDPTDPTEPTNPNDTPTTPVNNGVENPKTSDSIFTSIILAIISLGAISICAKKIQTKTMKS